MATVVGIGNGYGLGIDIHSGNYPIKSKLVLYVLLKALPPVCMKYTARGESRVANIARHKTLTKSCILSYKWSGSVLSVLLYFTLKDVLTEDTPLRFNTFIE